MQDIGKLMCVHVCADVLYRNSLVLSTQIFYKSNKTVLKYKKKFFLIVGHHSKSLFIRSDFTLLRGSQVMLMV